MIDPLHSLAVSLQANWGVYAVLIGSGVSRAAGIPTGWEVTIDLIRKLAAVHNKAPNPDPETWLRSKLGIEPDYSDLLDQLAKTPNERQQLLREYWEPTKDEGDERGTEPTAAHHAIAALAARGFIRVIITTNFDRLMERALSTAGVEATVLSTEDQIRGAQPLIHIGCCVLKVHGDYHDTRIRNTAAELAEYPEETNRLLDRVFDEFGLVVCGWSGDWDPALREALERAPSRRYTTYWTTRSRPSDVAERLIAHRSAETIVIESADTFFVKLKEYVQSIVEVSKVQPTSVDVSVRTLKRYISEPRHEMELFDLIDETVQQVVEGTSGENFSPTEPKPTLEGIKKRLQAYDAACSKLISLAAVGGAWIKEEHYAMWHRALKRLGAKTNQNGFHNLVGPETIPGNTLALCARSRGSGKRATGVS